MTTEQTGATIAPQPSLTDALLPLVAPIAQQAVQQATADLQGRLTMVEGQLADALAKQAPVLETKALVAGAAVVSNLEHDTLTQRVIVWGLGAVVLLMALIILIAALLGNVVANHWIGAAPAAVAAFVLWVSRTGTELPVKTAKPLPVPEPAQP